MSSTDTYPGLFITFEGGDSCGKSTQIALTKQWLEERGVAPLLTREPGGTELGEKLRELIIHGPDDMDPHTEALLYSAQRAYHMETKVRPALLRGEVVLQDRYLDSSVAYQGAARALGVDEILQLNLWAVRGLLPDVTILLDLDPEVAFARRTGEPDRLEREPNSFQHRVREQYYELSKTYSDRYRVIDASGDIESVQQQIRRALEPLVEEHLRANKVGNA
ncbi:dTMP kinase [Actinomyces urinae]|uniref:dTMP kinase n=1 Tax=Actinomyces urinae TaxID=1689268 RepID=UPI0009315F90|nr:dTMP kinase [Actinomyces urinae]